ncbi:MAG: hypothetical protein P4M11_09275 [Candidatus Pacebacteria bacterium]|nr:hypothetical protein [Candidatus Paceibacterota bacterium]
MERQRGVFGTINEEIKSGIVQHVMSLSKIFPINYKKVATH